jgi:hypothetical protein
MPIGTCVETNAAKSALVDCQRRALSEIAADQLTQPDVGERFELFEQHPTRRSTRGAGDGSADAHVSVFEDPSPEPLGPGSPGCNDRRPGHARLVIR